MIELKVPFELKDIVKCWGARWNQEKRIWYIPDNIEDIKPFERFINDTKENIDDHFRHIEELKQKAYSPELPFPDIGIVPNYDFIIPELKDRNFVILDTETTGTGKEDEITELGIIDADGNEVYRSLFFVTRNIPPQVELITGITNEKLIGKPRFINEWDKIKQLIGNRKVMAYNTIFDKRMIIQTVKKYDGDYEEAEALLNNTLDAMCIYAQYVHKCKLSEAAKECGIDIVQTHRATDDCLMTLKVLQVLDTKLKEQNLSMPKSSLKTNILNCLMDRIFDIDEISSILNVETIKIEDCIVKDFTLQEIKDIPGFRFENYYSPYEYLRVTAHLTKKDWDKKYKSLKTVFPEISYRSLKFIVKAFKKGA